MFKKKKKTQNIGQISVLFNYSAEFTSLYSAEFKFHPPPPQPFSFQITEE